MMFQPKIIFFDIDDTLYIKKQGYILESTKKALHLLQQQGVIIAIATGRGPSVMPIAVKQLIQECGINLVVSINGQYVSYREKAVASFPMSVNMINNVIKHLEKLGINYAFVSDKQLSVAKEERYLLAAVQDLRLPYCVDPFHHQHLPVYQMLAFFPQQQDNIVASVLPNELKIVRWHDGGVDILEKEASKARGIQSALTALDLNMDDAMAFGDGANDVEMLSAVGFGVAMGNAAPELQCLADYVCPSADDDGIYRCLRDLGLI